MLDMIYLKSTKNTHVFKSNNDESEIPTIYIKQSAFEGEPPNVLKVIVSDTYE